LRSLIKTTGQPKKPGQTKGTERKKKPKQRPKFPKRWVRYFELRRQFKTMNEILALNREQNLRLPIFPTITKRRLRYKLIKPEIVNPNSLGRLALDALEQILTINKMKLDNRGFVTPRENWKILYGVNMSPRYCLVKFSNIKKEKPMPI